MSAAFLFAFVLGTRRTLVVALRSSSLPSSISSATAFGGAGEPFEAVGAGPARGAGLTADATLLRFGRGIMKFYFQEYTESDVSYFIKWEQIIERLPLNVVKVEVLSC